MCIATYIPSGNQQFIITCSREQAHGQTEAIFPAITLEKTQKTVFPRDPETDGTWIASSSDNKTAIVLESTAKNIQNKHLFVQCELIPSKALHYDSLYTLSHIYDFSYHLPFNLLLFHHGEHIRIEQLIWDGDTVSVLELDPTQPHIWFSASHYDIHDIEIGKLKFESWFAHQDKLTLKSSFDFHFNYKKFELTEQHSLQMSDLNPVNITTLHKTNEGAFMHYHDVKNQYKHCFLLKNEHQLEHVAVA